MFSRFVSRFMGTLYCFAHAPKIIFSAFTRIITIAAAKINLKMPKKTDILKSSQWRFFRVCRRCVKDSLHSPWWWFQHLTVAAALVMALHVVIVSQHQHNYNNICTNPLN